MSSEQIHYPTEMALHMHSLKIWESEGGVDSFSVVGEEAKALSEFSKLDRNKKQLEKHVCCQMVSQ